MYSLILLVIVIGFIIFRFGGSHKNTWSSGTSFFRENPGARFERHVDRRLDKFESHGGKVLSNCYFRWENGVTTQIDEILILKSGIYVIECKDFKGWIFGNDVNDRWTVTYRSGRFGDSNKHSFYNPVKQNKGHIKYISSILPGYKGPIRSIIVFSNECSFKNITNNSDAYIIKEGILIETILRIDSSVDPCLTDEQITKVYEILKEATESDPDVKTEHINNAYIATNRREEQKTTSGPKCPRCGNSLVVRRSEYGRFYGCSDYPSCKYTRNIER